MINDWLFTLAMDFYRSQLWRRRGLILTVRLSDGRTAYVLFGLEAQHACSVSVFVGEEEMQAFLRYVTLMEGQDQNQITSDTEALSCYFDLRVRTLRFEYFDEYTSEELEALRLRAHQLGVAYPDRVLRGSDLGEELTDEEGFPIEISDDPIDPDLLEECYPALFSVLPWHYPGRTEDPMIMAAMEEILEALHWLTLRLQKGPVPLLTSEETQREQCFLMLVPGREDGNYTLSATPMPELKTRTFPLQSVPDPEIMPTLLALPHRESYEVCLTPLPGADDDQDLSVTEGGGCVPVYLEILHDSTNQYSSSPIVRDFADHPGHLLEVLTRQMLELGVCPESVYVSDDRTWAYLSTWCEQAGILLTHVSVDRSAAEEEDGETESVEETAAPAGPDENAESTVQEEVPAQEQEEISDDLSEAEREAREIEQEILRKPIEELAGMPEGFLQDLLSQSGESALGAAATARIVQALEAAHRGGESS